MLVPAFDKYQLRSMLCLYDAVAMVAECSGQALNQPQYVEMLMPKLIAQWNELGDADRPLLPLFECLMAVATALGEGFGPFTPPVFGRCVRLVNQRNAGGCPHDAAEFATVRLPHRPDMCRFARGPADAFFSARSARWTCCPPWPTRCSRSSAR